MPIDFEKPPHVLVVHGVQISEDRKIGTDTQIRALIARSLSDAHLERDFSVYGYFYEDINDNAVEFYKRIATALARGWPLVGPDP